MAKISRNTETVASSVQDRPIMTTEAKEIYCLEDGANLSRNLAEQEDEDEGAEDDEDVGHDEVSQGNHLMMHEHQGATTDYHHDHSSHLGHHHHHHPDHHQHAPACKLVSAESAIGPEPARYQHRPHCLHHDHQHLHHPHTHLHKPNCAVHNSNQPLGSNQKLFKNLIAQQHVQLSAATMKMTHGLESTGRLHAVYRPTSNQTRHLKLSPPVAAVDPQRKSKYLLVEYQRPSAGGRSSNLAPSLSPSGASIIRRHDDRSRINIRQHHHSRHMTTTNVNDHTRQPGTKRQKQTRTTTTVNFIAQLYFLIHLSAMISLLLHHRNLVSNESRASANQHRLQQQQQQQTAVVMQTMQQLSQQEQQQIYAATTTRRSSQIALPPNAVAASHSDRNYNMHHRRGHIQLRANTSDSHLPSLPVPETLQMPMRVHHDQINVQLHPDELTGANDVSMPNGRLVRSIFGPDLNSHMLDARSPDILVRLVGRTHAESALQYFLCYLLSSSITILVFLWLVRICTATASTKSARPARGHRWTKRSGRLIETRQDCTPVLIGSISLGLIQLIVIGLDIADNIDWLTTSAGHTPLGLTANYAEQMRAHGSGSGGGQWPIFVPMLQFVFVSLLMQYILAKVARIRGLMGLIEQEEEEDEEDEEEDEGDKTDDEESERRDQRLRGRSRHRRRQAGGERREERKSLSDNLQNIALAHLLVTHILLWLMKLNSISLFQTSGGGVGTSNLDHQQVFVPFVVPPLPPLTTSGGSSSSTTVPPATTSSTTQPTPRRTTAAPSFVLDHFGAAGETASSSVEPELHQGERNNGQAVTTTTATTKAAILADERPRREKVLSSLRNANLLADNHLTGARAKQPQLVIVAASRAVDNSSATGGARVESPSSTTTTSTTGRPSETTTTTTPRLVITDARAPIDETNDAHDRDEFKLISLVPPPPPISSSTSTTTRAPQTTTAAVAANNTKNERDLYANSRRRPLAPKTYNDDANDDGDRLEPIQVSTERPPTISGGSTGRQRASLSPMSPVRVDTTAAKSNAGLQSTLAELRPANLSASLFKSSLPKRMTAFRQGRPSQRVNLASGGSTTSKPASTASTAPPIGSTTSTTALDGDKTFSLKSSVEQQNQRPSRGGGGEQRHRVRVTVDREHSFPHSIDLTAVIPVPVEGNRATSESEKDEQEGENEISDSPPATPFRTTERPFPSVDDDPPPSTTTSTTTTTTKSPKQRGTGTRDQLDQAKEREPNESVAVATNRTRVVATPTQGGKNPAAKIAANGPPRPVKVTTTPMPSTAAEDDDQSEDEADDSTSDEAAEVDLDALLPPVPNYSNETSGDATSGGGGEDGAQTDEEALKLLASETPRRRARKMRPGTNTTSLNQALLDEAAFVFNEAASSQVANVTVRPTSQANSLNGTSQTTTNMTDTSDVASNSTHSLDSVTKEALTMQSGQNQQGKSQQQQPTFSDFLLPIVQQYHILVLTILFNMWLDSMQQHQQPQPKQQALDKREDIDSGPTMAKHQSEAHASQRRSTPKRHLVVDRSSSSSGGDLSPGASSSSAILGGGGGRSLSEAELLAHAVDSSSMSRDSSTKHLVSAQDLARHDKQRAAGRARRLLVDSSQQVAVRRRHALAVAGPRRGRSRTTQLEVHTVGGTEISSSVCSVFFGLLVVSGSLIVILLGVDLLSLLVQCAIQLISIAICLLGLCIVWRIKKSARSVARQLEARRLSRARRGRDQKSVGTLAQQQQQQQTTGSEQEAISHKSSFHYLFLLAAYYCGISVALNLGQQHQIQRLFPPPVIQFLQRLLASNSRQMDIPFVNEDATQFNNFSLGHPTNGIIPNLQFLFYCALTLKGLVLIVQVTLQTILIRSSWRWSGARAELRQIYTFLMFTNLSLWALEICDQQQQMLLVKHQHQHQVAMQHQQQQQVAGMQHLLLPTPSGSHNFELLTLEGFTRFAGSVVTLSHLYHGLVFMQH